MTGLNLRKAEHGDRQAIAELVEAAFGQPDEARLVEALVAGGHAVLELVAVDDSGLVGHVLFSRLVVEAGGAPFQAVALAPVGVSPDQQGQGIGTSLIEEAHRRLRLAGEALSVVLGEPAYYGRFGYTHPRGAGFDCAWQGEYLQALAWRGAPESGRLVYAPPFSAL